MPMLNMRYVLPDDVIDLNRVDGLSGIEAPNGSLSIGGMTRQREIEFSELVSARCPIMTEAILQVGHRQTRNRGTLGGSLAHLDPSAELPGGGDGARRDDPCREQARQAGHRDGRLPGRLHDTLDRARRDRHRREFPAMG